MFPPVKYLKAEDQYSKQTIKTANNPHKQTVLLQRKNKALVADYINLNATAELNFKDVVYVLTNYSCTCILVKSMGERDF